VEIILTQLTIKLRFLSLFNGITCDLSKGKSRCNHLPPSFLLRYAFSSRSVVVVVLLRLIWL